ncbi:Tetratricopeptide TPR_2 repeat protein [Candidatus Accumulibacter aalborgensis]|uniref:Tetratricopeptide TPR_2 repeat protein n=1 Tax=Candidatus Accumulibacter aalborgensis TaxID=1860102 RepID=A0A1A8XER9_9PROT|nr:TRAFs-binding domain-containing protein [Candidatus Accumulibacter aalborgensis]SBT03684.1 Tetratricopeptide TPR_2 repeat protein [Candidatus Accumulibacter aalborgensis]
MSKRALDSGLNNVWYELGVRHALRARGVVLVRGPRPNQPFDIYTDRKLHYSLRDGAPDPATLAADRHAMTEMVRASMASSTRRKVSPVFQLIPNLEQPEWRRLLLAERNEFSDAYASWASRMEVARQRNRPGDILLLADETPMRALHVEAKRCAGNALLKLKQYDLALEQFERALDIDSDDKISREKKSLCLSRLGRFEEAREWVRQLTDDYPQDAECWAQAGRVEKDNWMARWRQAELTPAQMHAAASDEDAALGEAIDPYYRAFVADPTHHYAGINALTLQVLRQHCAGDSEQTVIERLIGGVQWASLTAQERNRKDYWARASFAELCLLVKPVDSVRKEYGNMVAAANRDWFALESSRLTLTLFQDIDFRPAETAVALGIVEREIARSKPPVEPRQVLLFSGHMIDPAGRVPPRFPAEREALAAEKIGQTLDQLGVGTEDLALAQAASGGDMLFLEACRARGVRLQPMLPFDEPEFIERSILPASNGERWRERYFNLLATLEEAPWIMPIEIGALPRSASGEEANAFERCNLWLLYTALAWGVSKVRFICLWNGGGGDGPGGTAHMYNEVKRRTGRVSWLDTRTLW